MSKLSNPKPTGKHRYRTNWRGQLVLQLQFEGLLTRYLGGKIDTQWATGWRDARLEDLTSIGYPPSRRAKNTESSQ